MLDGKHNHMPPMWLFLKWHSGKCPKYPSSNSSNKHLSLFLSVGMEPSRTEGRRRSVGMEPPWKSLRVIVFLRPFFIDIFLFLFFFLCIYSCFGYGLLLDIIRRKWNWSDYFCLCTLHFSTFFGHTHCRPILRHDIHNQKPTYHRKATNFRVWDPLSKTKSQHKFTGYKITNTNSNWLRSTNTNPHFLINAFQNFRSQSQLSTDPSPRSVVKVRERRWIVPNRFWDHGCHCELWIMTKTKPKSDPATTDTTICDQPPLFTTLYLYRSVWIGSWRDPKHQIVSEREGLILRIRVTSFGSLDLEEGIWVF